MNIVKSLAVKNVEDEQALTPDRRNPATVRAANDILGGGKPLVSIHNGPQMTVNINQEDFKVRLKRLREVAATYEEVPVEGSYAELVERPVEAPQGADHRAAEDGSPDDR